MQAVAGEHLAGGEPINTMMNKYGIIKGETEENPIKTARTAAGLSEATPDMFDEVGSGAFWKALPGEVLDSGLHTGAEIGKSIGRFLRDSSQSLSDASAKQNPYHSTSATYDTVGQTKAYH